MSRALMFSWCAPHLYQLLIFTHFSSDPPETLGPSIPPIPTLQVLLAAQELCDESTEEKETFRAPNQRGKHHYGI